MSNRESFFFISERLAIDTLYCSSLRLKPAGYYNHLLSQGVYPQPF